MVKQTSLLVQVSDLNHAVLQNQLKHKAISNFTIKCALNFSEISGSSQRLEPTFEIAMLQKGIFRLRSAPLKMTNKLILTSPEPDQSRLNSMDDSAELAESPGIRLSKLQTVQSPQAYIASKWDETGKSARNKQKTKIPCLEKAFFDKNESAK